MESSRKKVWYSTFNMMANLFIFYILSIKKIVLWFWTCIYFYVLSDRVFHSDHDGSHGFAQFGHFTGFFTGLSWKTTIFAHSNHEPGTWNHYFFHIIWKYKSWSYRHRFVSLSTMSVGAPTQVKWRVNLSAKTL